MITLIVEDALMFLLAAYSATVVVLHRPDAPFAKPGELLSVAVFVSLWLGMFAALGLYQRSFAFSARDELYHVIGALALGIVPQMVLFTAWPAISTSRQILLFAFAFAMVLVGGVRVLEHLRRSRYVKHHPRHIALVGPASHMADTAAAFGDRAGTILHHFVVPSEQRAAYEEHLTAVAWYEQARYRGCDLIVLTAMVPSTELFSIFDRAAGDNIAIALAPAELRSHGVNLHVEKHGRQILLVTAPLTARTRAATGIKRAIDVVGAMAGIAMLAPLWCAVACMILLESGSPAVYRQTRVGRFGKRFEMLKFRTMRAGAEQHEGAVYACEGDVRLTRVGRWLRRFSIDETLQLINVLLGEMSLVGPRPERPEFVAQYNVSIPRYAERHAVRPGITGWSQIHLPRILSSADTTEKLECDLFYIENWSNFVDISIIVKTAFEFLFHRTV